MHPRGGIHKSMLNQAAWVKLSARGPIGRAKELQLQRLRELQERHKNELKSMMWQAPPGTSKLQYKFGDCSAIYSFAPWVALTANRGLPFKIE